MKTALPVIGLLLLVGIPFWFSLRPSKHVEKRYSNDSLTRDQVTHLSENERTNFAKEIEND